MGPPFVLFVVVGIHDIKEVIWRLEIKTCSHASGRRE